MTNFYHYPYQNPERSVEERVEDLLARMSVEEKMGQIVCYFPRKLSKHEELEKNYVHGVGQVSALEMRALDTLEDAARFQREIQEKVMALSEHHIPAIFHMEGLCGAYLQGATSFPSGIGRGSSWDTQLEEEIGKIVGRQERQSVSLKSLRQCLIFQGTPGSGDKGRPMVKILH